MAKADDAFEIEFRWKEQCVYWEGTNGFAFDGAWGVEPIETYIPDEETWDRVVPGWLVGRRAVVVSRLMSNPNHVVRTDPGYMPYDRTVTRP